MNRKIDKNLLQKFGRKDVPEVPRGAVRAYKVTAGVELARFLLFIMCGFTIIAVAILIATERRAADDVGKLSQSTALTAAGSVDGSAPAQTSLDRTWQDRLAVRKLWAEILRKFFSNFFCRC
jgi:hypothetical protein